MSSDGKETIDAESQSHPLILHHRAGSRDPTILSSNRAARDRLSNRRRCRLHWLPVIISVLFLIAVVIPLYTVLSRPKTRAVYNGLGITFTDERTGPIVQALQQRYRYCCGSDLKLETILGRGMIDVIESNDEAIGVLVGHEMWNNLSLAELDDPFRFYPNQNYTEPFPYTVLAYGKNLEQGRALLQRMGADRVDFVSYPSLERAWANRRYIARFLFRDVAKMDWDQFKSFFSGKMEGYLLSTMNQWMILERLADGTYPDEILIFEDDMAIVPDFDRKFQAIRAQLATVSWDVVFLGACFGIRSWEAATQNLFIAKESRCFNAVLLKASVARRILEAGVCVDTFAAVDHLFNHYIKDLNLNVFFVDPVLAYEQSKNSIQFPC